ncbi:hypothetical protein [Sphingobacterium sp. LRF_L2]|uniref:hypothetical protein n=1 Tax=Sphingobacterium sp. LRF_L2 TaxID=3369421 RepID=UPI003F63F8D8
MYQQLFIQTMQDKKNTDRSLIDIVSEVLDISYDAAHRRLSLKSKFSIEETVLLAKHFVISMDNIFQGDENVVVKKTKEILNFQDLSRYLESAQQSLDEYPRANSTHIYYSAKDIPLFYTIKADNPLAKFKLFVWLNLLSGSTAYTSFENFQLEVPLIENTRKLTNLYKDCTKNEIWNDTTINSTLQQIVYFFESGLLRAETGKLLCEELKGLLLELELSCVPNNEQYRLYYHELLILNNNVLVSNADNQSLFVPYTMLGYFITKDYDTCINSSKFFTHQCKNSKLLNTAGTRDKKIFFNRAYQKIDFYERQIISNQEFGYL